MKKILFLICSLSLSIAAFAQSTGTPAGFLRQTGSAPSGACSMRGEVAIYANTIYVCPQSGTAVWTAIIAGTGISTGDSPTLTGAWTWTGGSASISGKVYDKGGAVKNVMAYGAVCDGTTNDSTAINQLITDTIAEGGGEIRFPAGKTCKANLVVTLGRSLKFTGAGRISSKIRGTGTEPTFKANGFWYSQIEGIGFEHENGLTGKGVVEIDGNYDGTNTQGVQANTYKDVLISAQGINDGIKSDYSLTFCRQGSSSGQCSEQLLLNVHLSGAKEACLYQSGYNALNNTYIGGNIQDYTKHGIYLQFGSMKLYSIGFQSTSGYTQILNNGYDINANSGGVNERIIVDGCRTESLRFYRGANSQTAVLRGNEQYPAVASSRLNNASLTLNTAIYKTVGGVEKLFIVTTAGTSGGSEPTWPASGTIADGSAVWTQTDFTSVDIADGDYNYRTNNMKGLIKAKASVFQKNKVVTADYTVLRDDQFIFVDASAGAVTITLPTNTSIYGNAEGQTLTIKRYETSSNNVTISFATEPSCTNINPVLPGGTRDGITLVQSGGPGGACNGTFRVVNYFEDPTNTITAAGTTGNQTINKYKFAVNFAAAATSLTVTNPLVSSSSTVICTVQTNDSTLKSVAATPGSGSVVLTANAAATGETRVACQVLRDY